VRDGRIQYGLVAVKGLGEKAVDAIVRERDRRGPYRSTFDFCARVDLKSVNKSTLEQLIKCGAFDGLGPSRARMLAASKDSLEDGNRVQAERRAGQLSLFGDDSTHESVPSESYPDVSEWSEFELLAAEKEALGFYMSGHPLERRSQEVAGWRSHAVCDLSSAIEGSEVCLGVMVRKVRTRQTKKGDTMAFLAVEDLTGSIEIIVFPSTYESERAHLVEDAIVLIIGTCEKREESIQLRAERIVPLEQAYLRLAKRIGVTIDCEAADESMLFRLKELLRRHRGEVPVSIVFVNAGGEKWVVRLNPDLSVQPSDDMLGELRALVGPERIRVERNGNG
jgi:DNA polymerase-3 subunit alpha